jgi:hypothetical protein
MRARAGALRLHRPARSRTHTSRTRARDPLDTLYCLTKGMNEKKKGASLTVTDALACLYSDDQS